MWDLSSLTRDWTHASCNGSADSFFFFLIYLFLFIYFWLRWVIVALCRFSLVAPGRGYSPVLVLGLPRLWSRGSRRMGSAVAVHGLSCSTACGIAPDQGLNPGNMDSQPLDCQLSTKESMLWTVVLEKTLESPLGCKEVQPVHPKGDQSWVFIGRTDVEAETPIL